MVTRHFLKRVAMFKLSSSYSIVSKILEIHPSEYSTPWQK